MLVKLGVLLAVASLGAASARSRSLGGLTPEAESDLITDLPGLNFPSNFTQYSGYLSAGSLTHLHYWFIESVPDKTAPLLLWMNGGPGCSSLDGLLTELGPFWVNEGGETLHENIYSWNTFANVIYLESPACVGFSYHETNDCFASDITTAEKNYNALKEFFIRFPDYVDTPFYVTGESYGGIYVPTLSVEIVENQKDFPINLQGYAVGNGLTSYELNDDSLIFFANYHGLVGADIWTSLVSHCCEGGVAASKDTCKFSTSIDSDCRQHVSAVFDIVYGSGLNYYSLYNDCAYDTLMGLTPDIVAQQNLFRKFATPSSRSNVPCLSTQDATIYLNKPEVRKALHIPDHVRDWTVCSSIVSALYSRSYSEMSAQFIALHEAGIKALIFNGDTDMACNFLGDEWFVEALNFPEVEAYTPWMSGRQVAGFVKRFDKLDFVTIKGSGHMVPQDKPEEALQLIKAFVYGTPY